MDFCDSHFASSHQNHGHPSTSPEEIKLLWDGKLFIPSMNHFFKFHPRFNIWAMTADSGFDDALNYKYLFEEHNILPIIALNPRNTKQDYAKPGINQNGIPTCPKDPTLPMKWDGLCKGKNRAPRNKFICPKAKKLPGGKYLCSCNNKCTNSDYGRMFYTYPKDNYRFHTPIPRNTELWNNIASFRHIIEQVISRIKLPLQLGSLRTRNRKTTKADFFMAGAAHLVTVLLAYRIEAINKLRSTKSIAA